MSQGPTCSRADTSAYFVARAGFSRRHKIGASEVSAACFDDTFGRQQLGGLKPAKEEKEGRYGMTKSLP
jgi:hypothetical protein